MPQRSPLVLISVASGSKHLRNLKSCHRIPTLSPADVLTVITPRK
jgi:hypothetical protein